ncbi:hypothetical protein BUALT_Bualt06G0078700 [Buddleja alternifolia]|uniref:Prolamin-like domain-containing protein n=1 Tax=Buddleja alternifolia TaxID=168488 RepID=A0AAV6XF09_9LAMI|nr:hypothetical protein BUALT_Bualt06G0078700 [Buddleja alternifolia]
MAKFHLLFALAVALAALSAQARKTNTFHIAAAPFHAIHPMHLHSPPSATKKHAAVPSGGRGHVHHAAAPSPATVEFALSPEPYPGFYDTCLSKVSNKCKSEIYNGIFENDDVSATCCREIVGSGRRCHEGIVKGRLDQMKGLQKVYMIAIEKRGRKVWQECVLVTNLIRVGVQLSI